MPGCAPDFCNQTNRCRKDLISDPKCVLSYKNDIILESKNSDINFYVSDDNKLDFCGKTNFNKDVYYASDIYSCGNISLDGDINIKGTNVHNKFNLIDNLYTILRQQVNDLSVLLAQIQTQNVSTMNEIRRYQLLYDNVIFNLLPILENYSHGIDISSQFTYNQYRNIGLLIQDISDNSKDNDISNVQYDFSYTFNNYLSTFHKTLDGLQRDKIKNESIETLEDSLEIARSILDDAQSLLEYYKSRYTSTGINSLNTAINLKISPQIKTEYLLYIERFGLPDGGIFDSEKMSGILKELNIE
tara:strand:- start:749 stop:1651 length:903 start_codon:yes stop_codon:yes gene_type:complete